MAEVSLVVDIATKKAVKELNKLETNIEKVGKKSKKAGKETDKSLALISKGAAGAAIAVAALGAAVIKAVGAASTFQDLETRFISFTGSAESAAVQVERLAEFSGQTPFQLEDLANANRTLLAFGSSTEESFVQLKQLGEVAAGTGNSIGELSQIFGQIQVAGRLTGERFNQLAERGVNLGPALAKGLGVAESELTELRRQGKITSEQVAIAFASLTEGSGQFAGSMERLSKTFTGATSTLNDNIDLLAADLGKLLLPIITDVVIGLTSTVKAIRELAGTAPKVVTVTTEIDRLGSSIEQAEKNAGEIQKTLDGIDPENTLAFSKVNAELQKTNQIIEQQTAQLQRLKQVQQNEVVKKREEDEASAEVERAEKEAEKLKKIEEDKKQAQIAVVTKLNEELQQLSDQRQAIEVVAEQESNAKLVEQLDIKRELIVEKEKEKNIALLEAQGLYEEASREQAQNNLDKIEAAEKSSQNKRTQAFKQANADELNFAKIESEEKIKFEQKTNLGKAKALSNGLANLEALQKTGSKEAFQIGKAAALARAAIALPETALQAFKSGVGIGGPPLGAVFAAAATAVQLANIRNIQAQKFTGFAEGGLVTGGKKGIDSVPALLTPGEVVVPEKNFESLNFRGRDNDNLEKQMARTNELLVELVVNTGTTQSEGFLEEKFSSSTPGGIFYEAVNDGGGLGEIEVENVRQATGVGINSGRRPSSSRQRPQRAR